MKNLLLFILFAATAFAENPVELRYVPQTTYVYLDSMTNDVASGLRAMDTNVVHARNSGGSYYVDGAIYMGNNNIVFGNGLLYLGKDLIIWDNDMYRFATPTTQDNVARMRDLPDVSGLVSKSEAFNHKWDWSEVTNKPNIVTSVNYKTGDVFLTDYDIYLSGSSGGIFKVLADIAHWVEEFAGWSITNSSPQPSASQVRQLVLASQNHRDFNDVGFSQIVVTNDLPSVSVLCLTNNFQTSYLTDQIYFKTNALDPASVYSIKFPEEGGTFARMEDLTVLEASIREEAEDTWRKAVSNSIVIGRLAEGPASYITNGVEVSDYAVAVGNNAKALSYGDTVIGHCAYATNHHSIAIGKSATALLPESIAIGGLVGASSNPGVCGSVAIGHNSAAEDGSKGVALGYWAWSKGNNSTALGSHAYALAPGSVQIGVGVNNTPNTIKYHDQYLATQAFVMQALTNLVTTGITVNGKTYKLVEVTQ